MTLRLPKRFAKADLRQVDVEQFEAVIKFNKGELTEGMGLLVCGPPGVGKTYALAALSRRWADRKNSELTTRPWSFEFVTAPTFFENLDPFNDEAWDTYRDRSWDDTYSLVNWLVINDLGKEDRAGKRGKQKTQLLGKILRARSEAMLLTHVTTNFNGKQLREEYGESIVSLMSEMMIPVIVDGPDRRKQ